MSRCIKSLHSLLQAMFNVKSTVCMLHNQNEIMAFKGLPAQQLKSGWAVTNILRRKGKREREGKERKKARHTAWQTAQYCFSSKAPEKMAQSSTASLYPSTYSEVFSLHPFTDGELHLLSFSPSCNHMAAISMPGLLHILFLRRCRNPG